VNDPADSIRVSQPLASAGGWDADSLDRLLPLAYRELHRLPHRCLRGSLQTTALLHEAYIRLMGGSASWNDRVHFLSIAARAMRAVLVDAMRSEGRQKRGGGLVSVTSLRPPATSPFSRSTKLLTGWRNSMRAKAAWSSFTTSGGTRGTRLAPSLGSPWRPCIEI
jgi:DNA-directed RNA polymerase specialized sigma24 family protein